MLVPQHTAVEVTTENGYVKIPVYGREIYNEIDHTTTCKRSFTPETYWSELYPPSLIGHVYIPEGRQYRFAVNFCEETILLLDGESRGHEARDAECGRLAHEHEGVFFRSLKEEAEGA